MCQAATANCDRDGMVRELGPFYTAYGTVRVSTSWGRLMVEFPSLAIIAGGRTTTTNRTWGARWRIETTKRARQGETWADLSDDPEELWNPDEHDSPSPHQGTLAPAEARYSR